MNRPRHSYMRQLLLLLASRWSAWSAVLAASLVLNLCGLAAPRITQAVFDRVVPTGDFLLLTRFLFLLLLVTAVQIGLTVWRRVALVRLSLQIDQRLLSGLCAHLLTLPLAFFKRSRAGDLLARFQEHSHVRHLFAGGLTRVGIDAVMVVLYVAVMFAYSWRLTLWVLVLLLLLTGYTLRISPTLKRQHRRLLDDNAAQEARLLEALVSIDLVKALAVEGPLQARWEMSFQRYLTTNERTQALRQVLESGSAVLRFLSTGVLLGYGSVLVLREELSIGQLVAFSLYAGQAMIPLLGFVTLWDEIQQARAALDRLEEILSQEPEPVTPKPDAAISTVIKGHFRVEQVSFDYGAGAPSPALSGLNFEVRSGDCFALVGPSGSGKTTLARLLLGLYRPTGGRILVDGRDLVELDLAAYRSQVGVVLQENLLISGTIAENIALGDPNLDMARLTETARLVGAHEFIQGLAQGYQTPVGEMGLTLSGGQRQRIALARALYRNPRILLLDEATSALDGVSMRALRANLPAICAGRTTILIAHNLATVRLATRILVLDQGVIVEEGTHEELLARSGLYYDLVGGQLDF